jgi:hypothetical protein
MNDSERQALQAIIDAAKQAGDAHRPIDESEDD